MIFRGNYDNVQGRFRHRCDRWYNSYEVASPHESKKKNWWKRLHDPQVKHSYSCKWEVYSDWCKVQWRPPFGRCSVLTWGDRTGDEYNEIRPFCAMLMFCSAFWMCLLSWTWLWKQDAIQQYNMINDECGMVWLVMVNSHDNYCSIVGKGSLLPTRFQSSPQSARCKKTAGERRGMGSERAQTSEKSWFQDGERIYKGQ